MYHKCPTLASDLVHYSRISSELELKHGHGLELGLELRRDFELEHGHGLEGAEISKKRVKFGVRVALWWSEHCSGAEVR